jgi:probable F420-dependent oxidoreductase
MKFGLSLMGLAPRLYGDVAATAEQHGFESVWVPEHLVLPAQLPPTYLYSETGDAPITPDSALYDPWVTLGFAANATERIRLATNVFILPLRHPFAVARSVLTVDRISNGRVTLGIGVGWLAEEFEYTGQSFHDRGRRTDEMIPLLRQLWSDPVVEHHSEHFDFGPVTFEPKPRQAGGIPIEVGGTSPAALRRAGRLGDGWIELGSRDLAEASERLATVQRHRHEADRDHLAFEVSFSGAFAEDLDGVRRCEEAGATRVVVAPSGQSDRAPIDLFSEFIKRYADEVIGAR